MRCAGVSGQGDVSLPANTALSLPINRLQATAASTSLCEEKGFQEETKLRSTGLATVGAVTWQHGVVFIGHPIN